MTALTIEQKLQHFESLCTRDATEKFEKMINDFTAGQEAMLNEHAAQTEKAAEFRIRTESEKLQREANKRLSISQISIKRGYSQKQEELKGKIFSELRDRLARFMETPEYDALLKEQILKAKEFAGEEEIHIYIDPSDQEKQNMLSLQTNCDVRVSQYPFLGGTRAVISAKNVLIDNSFETRLKESEENFQFILGGKES